MSHETIIDDVLEQERLAEDAAEKRRKAVENEKEHIKDWFEKIDQAIKHDKWFRERWLKDRVAARGQSKSAVSVNLISAIMAVLAAFLYAKNPDVSVIPSDSVDDERLPLYRRFGETIQVVVSRMYKDANLKKTAKRWIRGTQTVGIAWVKVMIQTRTEKSPLMANRINDLQDQINNINAKQIRLKLDDEQEGILISELQSNITAAQEGQEISVAEGLVLDYMDPSDVIVAPDCGEVENYLAAPWIVFRLYKNIDEILAITGWTTEEELACLKTANRFFKRPREDGDKGHGTGAYVKATSDEAESKSGFYMIYEAWSLADGVVYTLLDGCKERWAKERFAPVTGKRFYPCFSLAFHYIDGERYPQSDVHQLTKLQEEYNESRSDFRIHRQRARPGTIFNEAAVEEPSVRKLSTSVILEYIGVKFIKREPDINKIFFNKRYPPVDIGLYDTSHIQRDMEKVSGAQEALQQSIVVEKTATEAEIQEEGRGVRSGAKTDDLEDALTELSEYVIQVALQLLDIADAERYAGPQAMWLNLSVDEALQLFNITIKAGSTGKPKAKTDRVIWPSLMPVILDLIRMIGEFRLKGEEWAAKPIIAVLKETLSRADDTASIDMFLPVPPPEAIERSNQADPQAEAKTKLDTAGSIEKAASAVEKLPSLVFSPQVRALLGFEEQQEATVQDISGALQQPAIEGPDPLS